MICPCPSGAIGSLFHAGVVHPQDARTFVIVNGPCVVLVKLNTVVTRPSSSLITPKSCVVSSNTTTFACSCAEIHAIIIIANANDNNFFIVNYFWLIFMLVSDYKVIKNYQHRV